MQPYNGKSRNYCFTLNNPSAQLDFAADPRVTYWCYQEEIGDSGTHHFQGYIELMHPLSIRAIKRIDGMSRAHLEVRRGTAAQAKAYCQKPGGWGFLEGGTIRGNDPLPTFGFRRTHPGSIARAHQLGFPDVPAYLNWLDGLLIF